MDTVIYQLVRQQCVMETIVITTLNAKIKLAERIPDQPSLDVQV